MKLTYNTDIAMDEGILFRIPTFPTPTNVYEILDPCYMPCWPCLGRVSPGAVCCADRTKSFSNPELMLHVEGLKSSLQMTVILAGDPSPDSFLNAHDISLSAPILHSSTFVLFICLSLYLSSLWCLEGTSAQEFL